MKIMLDTNIMLAAVAFDSKYLTQLIQKAATEYSLVLCDYSIDEVYDVIKRKKPATETVANNFFLNLSFSKAVSPQHVPENERLFQIRDEDDYLILHTAIVEGVDVFVTNDKDFTDVDIDRPEILTPLEFMQKY
jgi:putative PIN family toxin of toxin-antitoxin system